MADAVTVAREWLKLAPQMTREDWYQQAARKPERLLAICTALIAETERAERLHGALRGAAVKNETGSARGKCCTICKQRWAQNSPERHAPGCLAAPLSEDAAIDRARGSA